MPRLSLGASFLLDARYSLRAFRENWRSTLPGLLSIALGLGVTTAMFSVVDAVLLNPFPYHEPNRLVLISGTPSLEVRRELPRDILEGWRSGSRTLEGLSLFRLSPSTFQLDYARSAQLQGAYVGSDLFDRLGVVPLIGPGFASDDASPDRVVLSHDLWTSMFQSAPDVLNRTMNLGGRPYVIVGVMPAGFFFPDTTASLWLPLSREAGMFDEVHAIGRLRAGASVEQCRAELTTSWRAAFGARADGGREVGVFPLHTVVVGPYRLAFWTLLALTIVLMLLACGNAANLLLARGVNRRGELAVRMALGGRPFEIARLVFLESAIVASLATLCGIAAAYWGIRGLSALTLTDIPGLAAIGLNARVLMFGIVAGLLTVVVAGTAPAIHAARTDVHPALQRAAGTTHTRHSAGLPEGIVALETALAVVVLVSAGLLLRSFVKLTTADWGFEPSRLVVGGATVPERLWLVPSSESDSGEAPVAMRQSALIETVLQRIRSLPGVASVAVARDVPLERGEWSYRPVAADAVLTTSGWPLIQPVGPGYFQTMGIEVLRGREFRRDEPSARRLAIVNEALARRLWPGQEAVGRELSVLEFDSSRPDVARRVQGRDFSVVNDRSAYKVLGTGSLEVIGVVRNVKMGGLEPEPEPAVFTDLRVWTETTFGTRLVFVARAAENAEAVTGLIRDVLRSESRDIELQRVSTMEALVTASIGGRGSNALLLATSLLFGVLSLVLAGAGVYAVVSHSCRQRVREIGIRVALGATDTSIVRMVTIQALRPVSWGCALGLTCAWAAARMFDALLFGVGPTDPISYTGAIVLLMLAGIVASVVPALIVLTSNPVDALRYE